MTGIVNSTGARSGVIGTTVGTPVGGKVLQVQHGFVGNVASTTVYASPGTTTGLAVAITPAASTSKIFLQVSIGMASSDGGTGTVGFNIYSSLTTGIIGIGNAASSRLGILARSTPNWNGDANHGAGTSFSYIDSPTGWSSGAITYTVYMWGEVSGTRYINRSSGDTNSTDVHSTRTSSTISAIEIGV